MHKTYIITKKKRRCSMEIYNAGVPKKASGKLYTINKTFIIENMKAYILVTDTIIQIICRRTSKNN